MILSAILMAGFLATNPASAGQSGETVTIVLNPSSCAKPGRTILLGELPTPADLATDSYCAARLASRAAPLGMVTVFGSARLSEGTEQYAATREFARLWTLTAGKRFPIATGGGLGLMEAANRGARDAGGRSLGLSTSFGDQGVERPNAFVTDGYRFASFSQREAELVDRAAAVVIVPGGMGTEWEIYETLSKIQTKKKNKVPVILLGKKEGWRLVDERVRYMDGLHTISHEDIELYQVAETPAAAVELLSKALRK